MSSNYQAGEISIPDPVMREAATFTWNFTIMRRSIGRNSWQSPSFEVSDQSGVNHRWVLTFCDGADDGTDIDINSVSLKRCCDSEDTMFVIKFIVSTLDHLGVLQRVCYNDTTDKNVPQRCFRRMPYTVIMPRVSTDNLLRLRISCNIIKICTRVEQNVITPRITLTQHEVLLRDEYELLFGSGNFSDITFVVGDKKLQLHRSILSSRSVVFAAMFENEFRESVSNEVHIEDQTYEVMKEFFRYIYSAKVNNIQSYAAELLALSNKYAVEGLKFLCEESLVKLLRIDNVLECLNLASLFVAKNLEKECLKYIALNAREVVKTPNFSINQLPVDLRDELFKLVAEKS